ncbi:MAG: hypothetical protein AB1500_07955 [Bacillota bacterium]
MFNYDISFFNPLLKIIIAACFFIATLMFYKAKGDFGGQVGKFVNLVSIGVLLSALGAFFRYFGHGTQFGFNEAFSLKWFESLSYTIGSILILLAGIKLLKFGK